MIWNKFPTTGYPLGPTDINFDQSFCDNDNIKSKFKCCECDLPGGKFFGLLRERYRKDKTIPRKIISIILYSVSVQLSPSELSSVLLLNPVEAIVIVFDKHGLTLMDLQHRRRKVLIRHTTIKSFISGVNNNFGSDFPNHNVKFQVEKPLIYSN